ncbi:hypothetical protein MBLNU459_g8089t1 [Dothideomycetes sp. NU459]
MDDPVSEIPHVISLLCETAPSTQLAAVEKYFTPSAEFVHPFCRTGSSASSRWLITRVYRWYKILSPRVSARVHSVSFDERNLVLYVGITQVFAIWAIPTHRSEVSLVTVLHLTRQTLPPSVDYSDNNNNNNKNGTTGEKSYAEVTATSNKVEGKYYITSQNDLYQTDQFIKFVLPWFSLVVPLWQFFATLVCVVMSYLFYPVTWYEENFQENFTRSETPPEWKDGK